MTSSERAYVLGTDQEELLRLGTQHRLWAESALRLWERAAIRPGERVLDVGCGPGFASRDLAALVGPAGAVVGVDESARFVAHFTREAASQHLDHVRALEGDVHHLPDLLRGHAPFDAAYIRWVLCFTRDTERVIRGIASALRPGGRIIIQDYFNYQGSTCLAPRAPVFDRTIEAVSRSWRDSGGDTDVMGRVPGWLLGAGFRIDHWGALQRCARPTDTMWTWPTIFWKSFLPRLVESGHLSAADKAEFDSHWATASADPAAFIALPTVFEVIATKAE